MAQKTTVRQLAARRYTLSAANGSVKSGATMESTTEFGRCFRPSEPVTLIDGKNRRYLVFPTPGERLQIQGGFVDADTLLAAEPGVRLRTSGGQVVVAYRTTLEEYVLMMPRAATVVPPKDIAFMVQWADVGPGDVVVEAGIGSGGLSLGLLRAVGETGRLVAFELREDHANRAKKNIASWREDLGSRLDLRLGDVSAGLETMQGVDEILLDLPEPHLVLPAAAQALVPGGLVVAYTPTIRQIDAFLLAVLNNPEFAEPEITEVLVRPWVGDRQRLRPELRMVAHTGFLARARRRGSWAPGARDA